MGGGQNDFNQNKHDENFDSDKSPFKKVEGDYGKSQNVENLHAKSHTSNPNNLDSPYTQTIQNSFYCLQPIVLKRKGEVYSLIDGQQRLTTIFLIIKYLQNRNLFKIEYETRRDSATFLENIKDRYSLPAENIDFWHFASAYKVILEFFKNSEIDRKIFEKTLLNHCKILWYEAKEEENDVFVRLNIGKIPLLESENIKALFLSKNDELDSDEIKERAEFWYESEIKARENNDLRYCILQKIKPDDISKDEYHKPVLSDDILRIEAYLKAIVKPNKDNKHYLFDYFYECYKDKSLNGKWQDLEKAIKALQSFTSNQGKEAVDREIFHYLGFLSLADSHIYGIYKYWLDLQGDKDKKGKFRAKLFEMIKGKVRDSIKNIDSLQYAEKKDRDKIFLLLLLSNLECILRDESSNDFFKFNRFVLEKWSLEHIYAQNSQSISKEIKSKNDSAIKEWLDEVLKYIDDKDLKQEIESSIKESKFSDRDLFGKIDENFRDDESLNSICNLTLLDKDSNSSLGNLIFSKKRKEIEKLATQDKLIPIMTKKVFDKSIEGLDNSYKDSFSKDDREAYLNYIKTLLEKYGS